MQKLPPMNVQTVWFLRLNLVFASIILALGMAGCATTDYKAAMVPPDLATNLTVPRLNVGDIVTITFSGLPNQDEMPAQVEKPIKEDGTISLPNIERVPAAGKTAGELEDEVHSLYVPAYYTHLNVTVKTTSDLVYFVRGEVKSPGRLIYVGSITVTKAITSAGDFSDFANRKAVILTRSSGPRFKLNCDKILDGRAPDPPVFPGDQIEVKRRWW
jgi:polysaccharide export outer membrane protein